MILKRSSILCAISSAGDKAHAEPAPVNKMSFDAFKKKPQQLLQVIGAYIVHRPGFEPGTYALEVHRSIQLSYQCEWSEYAYA